MINHNAAIDGKEDVDVSSFILFRRFVISMSSVLAFRVSEHRFLQRTDIENN